MSLLVASVAYAIPMATISSSQTIGFNVYDFKVFRGLTPILFSFCFHFASVVWLHVTDICIYIYTSIEALRRAPLLRRVVASVSVKALRCQCFIESTSNVSFADYRELGS